MINLIINADDLGINPTVNSEIEKCIKNGLISSATIMAMGTEFSDAVRIANENPKISFGVHLCLDEFESLTNSSTLHDYGLIDENGYFIKTGIYNLKTFDEEIYNAIYNELIAQVKKISDAGIKISHIDSHHHFHVSKLLFLKMIMKIANEYGINKVRYPISHIIKIRNATKKQDKVNSTKQYIINTNLSKHSTSIIYRAISLAHILIKKRIWISKANKAFKHTSGFYSYSIFFNCIDEFMPMIDGETIELMCHPGHPMYKEEVKLIEAGALKSKIPYCLMSYNEL